MSRLSGRAPSSLLWILALIALLAGCPGPLSLSSFVGRSSSSSSPSPLSSSSLSPIAGGGKTDDLADPPDSPDDSNLLTMPRFFQARAMHWAIARSPWSAFWLADLLGDQLGENARMVLVSWCLRSNDLAYMACRGDAHRLDRKRLAAELDAPAARPYRASALANFDALVKDVAAREAKLARREKDDPALAVVFDTIPKATWKQWDALAASHRDLLALARRLEVATRKDPTVAIPEHGPSRKAYAGCYEQLAPAFAKLARGVPIAKDPDRFRTFGIAATPASYTTTLAMYYCARGLDLSIAGALGRELTSGAMLRGPRMAIIDAVLVKGRSLRFDDKSYSVGSFVWRDYNFLTEDEELYGQNNGGSGVVSRVERHGDLVHVSFVPEPFVADSCVDEAPTPGAWHYDANTGNLTPLTHCVKWERVRVVPDAVPIDVPVRLAAAIRPGRYLEWQVDNGEHTAGVNAVWDSPREHHLFALYGVAR